MLFTARADHRPELTHVASKRDRTGSSGTSETRRRSRGSIMRSDAAGQRAGRAYGLYAELEVASGKTEQLFLKK